MLYLIYLTRFCCLFSLRSFFAARLAARGSSAPSAYSERSHDRVFSFEILIQTASASLLRVLPGLSKHTKDHIKRSYEEVSRAYTCVDFGIPTQRAGLFDPSQMTASVVYGERVSED